MVCESGFECQAVVLVVQNRSLVIVVLAPLAFSDL